jgi:DNA-binding CsgD family transcriptional regulator
MTAMLELARAAFDRRSWREAFDALNAAARDVALSAADGERHAIAAYLVGEDVASAQAWEAAHRAALEDDDAPTAARCAFWLGMCLLLRGQTAQAGGWLARTATVVGDAGVECAATGYLLIPDMLGALDEGDAARGRDVAVHAVELGRRFDDDDLRALGTLGHGQALIALGDTAAGTARLDEVMVSVASGELGPIASGIVYCAVIYECMALFDLSRAAEWTGALTAWLDAQPDLVPYRGQCLVHRSQLHMASGDWPNAFTTAEAACRRLTDPPHPALGLAYYQQAELHRLVGAFDEAEAAYRQASRYGQDPVPGLALLELARGDADGAVTTIRRALTERRAPGLLAAAVDVLRSAGDITGARAAADELVVIASTAPSQVLSATASQALGAVLVAEGDTVAGLAELRAAARAWQTLRMPYEAARTAVLLGLALAAMGDRAAAAIELDNARGIFTELGARPDLHRLAALLGPAVPHDIGLSAREREVLALLAAGKTNREIAAALHLSPHTIGRHLGNIFTKLGVTTRAAATAYAYEHGLLSEPGWRVRPTRR